NRIGNPAARAREAPPATPRASTAHESPAHGRTYRALGTRSLSEDERVAVHTGAREVAGPAGLAFAGKEIPQALARGSFRGKRRRGKGGHHSPRGSCPRPAPLQHRADRRTERRGKGSPVPLALLASSPRARTLHGLRPLVVWPGPRGTRRSPVPRGGLVARIQ